MLSPHVNPYYYFLLFLFFIFYFLEIYQNMGQKLGSNKGNQLLFKITVLSHQKRK